MNVSNISADSTSNTFSKSNVLSGILENQSVLAAFIDELRLNDVMDVEILQGNDGLSFLEQQEHSIRGMMDFFLGDMETDMRRLYASEIKQGRIVFGIPVPAKDKDRVIAIARNHHASAIAYFGGLIVESIESGPSEKISTMDAIAEATSGKIV